MFRHIAAQYTMFAKHPLKVYFILKGNKGGDLGREELGVWKKWREGRQRDVLYERSIYFQLKTRG